MAKQVLEKPIPEMCHGSHDKLDFNYNFTMKKVHEGCCDQCRHACTNGHIAPSMWCVKHKTYDGSFFIKEFGGGTGCDDFEEGDIWDYYTYGEK